MTIDLAEGVEFEPTTTDHMEATSVLYLIKKVEQSNCYTVKTWTWLLERTFPDRWGAKVEAKNSGQVDYTIQLRPAVTPERMKELYEVGRESIASPPRFRLPLQLLETWGDTQSYSKALRGDSSA